LLTTDITKAGYRLVGTTNRYMFISPQKLLASVEADLLANKFWFRRKPNKQVLDEEKEQKT